MSPRPAAAKQLERPAFKELSRQAVESVEKELGRIADPVERARRSGEIINEASDKLKQAAAERDRAMLSLWAWDLMTGLHLSAGISRVTVAEYLRALLKVSVGSPLPGAEQEERLLEVRARMRRVSASRRKEMEGDLAEALAEVSKARVAAVEEAGFTRVPDAEQALPRHAKDAAAARARIAAASPFRRDAVKVLATPPYSWNSRTIGEVAGVEPHAVTVMLGRIGVRRAPSP